MKEIKGTLRNPGLICPSLKANKPKSTGKGESKTWINPINLMISRVDLMVEIKGAWRYSGGLPTKPLVKLKAMQNRRPREWPYVDHGSREGKATKEKVLTYVTYFSDLFISPTSSSLFLLTTWPPWKHKTYNPPPPKQINHSGFPWTFREHHNDVHTQKPIFLYVVPNPKHMNTNPT